MKSKADYRINELSRPLVSIKHKEDGFFDVLLTFMGYIAVIFYLLSAWLFVFFIIYKIST